MLVSERHLQPLIPHERSAARIGLRERQPRHLARLDLQIRGNRRSPRLVHPHAAPGSEILVGASIENLNQVRPRRVRECETRQILAQPFAQLVRPENLLELAHDDRRLRINDRPVETARILQVVELLANRVCAGGAVDVVGGRIVLEEETQLVIDLGKRWDSRSWRP